MFSKKDDELTTSEVAEVLQVSLVSVNKYLKSGDLKGEKRGKSWYIKKTDLQAFIDSRTKRN